LTENGFIKLITIHNKATKMTTHSTNNKSKWAYIQCFGNEAAMTVEVNRQLGIVLDPQPIHENFNGYYSVTQHADHWEFKVEEPSKPDYWYMIGQVIKIPFTMGYEMGEREFKNVTPDKIVKV